MLMGQGSLNESDSRPAGDAWQKRIDQAMARLRTGKASWIRLLPTNDSSEDVRPRLLLPGSFNPLHRGHVAMASIASDKTALSLDFELSITNADKPEVAGDQLAARLADTVAGQSVDSPAFGISPHGLVLTSLPTFVEKAEVFPGSFFVIGVDTLVRIADARFYDDSPAARDKAIQQIAESGCRFLVFGRVSGNRFLEFRDLDLPGDLVSLCNAIPGVEFRDDISSSALRERDM
ncbi:MAG: hypothetical protein ACR2NP_23100 [Pirellulaceae bacterium]